MSNYLFRIGFHTTGKWSKNQIIFYNYYFLKKKNKLTLPFRWAISPLHPCLFCRVSYWILLFLHWSGKYFLLFCFGLITFIPCTRVFRKKCGLGHSAISHSFDWYPRRAEKKKKFLPWAVGKTDCQVETKQNKTIKPFNSGYCNHGFPHYLLSFLNQTSFFIDMFIQISLVSLLPKHNSCQISSHCQDWNLEQLKEASLWVISLYGSECLWSPPTCFLLGW